MLIDVIKRAIDLVPEVIPHLSNAALKSIGQYDRQLWEYTLALYRGGDPGTFIDEFASAIENQLNRAWNEGAREVGVEPGDMTEDDKQVIQDIIDSEYDHVLDLASAVEGAQSLDIDAFRSQFRSRIDLWVNRYNDVRSQAMVYFGEKTRMVWKLGATEEHCATCATLNGVVAYATEWEESGVAPQGPPNDALECGGWRCDCSLEVTEQRRSPNALTTIMNAATSGHL